MFLCANSRIRQPGDDSGVRPTECRPGQRTGLSRYIKWTSLLFFYIFNMNGTFCTAFKIEMQVKLFLTYPSSIQWFYFCSLFFIMMPKTKLKSMQVCLNIIKLAPKNVVLPATHLSPSNWTPLPKCQTLIGVLLLRAYFPPWEAASQ